MEGTLNRGTFLGFSAQTHPGPSSGGIKAAGPGAAAQQTELRAVVCAQRGLSLPRPLCPPPAATPPSPSPGLSPSERRSELRGCHSPSLQGASSPRRHPEAQPHPCTRRHGALLDGAGDRTPASQRRGSELSRVRQAGPQWHCHCHAVCWACPRSLVPSPSPLQLLCQRPPVGCPPLHCQVKTDLEAGGVCVCARVCVQDRWWGAVEEPQPIWGHQHLSELPEPGR